ncbi:MAG TPA: ABC transporter, partial [Alcanivorax sp.]|nr:ABC transporter [Alcanivorax sp.]HCO64862.1 ABC transporter [Alcanivorax sp.]
LFVALAEQNFEVMSMRNKANRLEELFVRLVEQNLPEQNPQREKAS